MKLQKDKSPYTEQVIQRKVREFPRHRFVPETVPNSLVNRDALASPRPTEAIKPQKSARRSRAQRLQNHQRTGSMGGSTSQKRVSDPVISMSPLVKAARESKHDSFFNFLGSSCKNSKNNSPAKGYSPSKPIFNDCDMFVPLILTKRQNLLTHALAEEPEESSFRGYQQQIIDFYINTETKRS